MATLRFPDELPGGDRGLNKGPSPRKGVFSQHPGMTPKYHTNNNNASLEYMARMFIPFGDDQTGDKRKAFINSFDDKTRSRELAAALATTGRTDTGNAFGMGYIDFLLQKAQESFQEKYQVVEVLGDNYVSYFFGQAPPVFTYSGTLLNSVQDDWRTAFHIMYNDIIRGTQMARKKLVVTLAYDDVFVTGVLVNMTQLLTAEFELGASFSFNILVKRFDVHSRFGGAAFPPTAVATYPYALEPGLFTNRQIEGVTPSIWNGESAVFTTGSRKKSAEGKTDIGDLEIVPNGYDPEVDYAIDSVYNGGAVRLLRKTSPVVDTMIGNLSDVFNL